MSDKQGTGFGLSRYWADLTNLLTGGAGSFGEVVVPVGNVAPGATDSGNPVKVGGVFNSTLPTLTNGQRGDAQLSARGSVRVQVQANGASGTDAMSNSSALAFVGGDTSQTNGFLLTVAPWVFNGTSWDRDAKANNTGRLASAAASTNATSVKASAGTIHCIEAFNVSAAVKFLKIYNKASAPTVGTDTPVRTIALKAADRTAICFPRGYYLATGIAYALTGVASDADTTALAAGDVVGLNIDYY